MKPSLEGWPTKAKEAASPHELRLALLDTNPVFQCLRDESKTVFSAVLHPKQFSLLKYHYQHINT